MRLPFDDWRPDLADLDQPVTTVAKNVVPAPNSNRPVPSSQAYSDALPAAPRGQWMVKTNAGDFEAWAATETTIQELVGTSWTERGSGLTGPGAGDNWAGVQFGTDLYFNNVNDGLYKFNIEGGTSVAAVSSSPNAKHMDVVGEYLCHGNTDTSPRQFVWSDTNNGDAYTGNSGSQTFPDGGAISAIVGSVPAIIQENIIREIIPTGTSEVFEFNKREESKGSISPGSVIRFAGAFAYLTEDGFWWNGEPIGQNAVNSYFLSQINQNNLYTVLGAFDPVRGLFLWAYRTSETETYDRVMVYSIFAQRWAEWEIDLAFLAQSATSGVTLEQLSALYPVLEDVPYPLDSRVWLGGRPVLSVIDTDYKLAFLEGANLEATMETGNRQLMPNRRSKLLGARPLVDASGATITVGKKQVLSGMTSWGSAISQQASGMCPLNAEARYHKLRLTVPAGASWTHAQGIEIPDERIVPGGDR